MIETSGREEEWRRENEEDIEAKAEDIKRPCSVCRVGLFAKDAYKHRVLGVVQCRKCYDFYNTGEFSEDEDGDQKYCTWCGEGGKLNYCSNCKKGAFCKACIKKNLGEKELAKVADDDWKCFLCNSKPLWKLRAYCDATIERVNMKKREKLAPNMLELLKLRKSQEEKKRRKRIKESSSEDDDDEKAAGTSYRRSSPLKARTKFVAQDDADPYSDSPTEDSSDEESEESPPRRRARNARTKSTARQPTAKRRSEEAENNQPSANKPDVQWAKGSLDDFKTFISKNTSIINKLQVKSASLNENSSVETIKEVCEQIRNHYSKCFDAFKLYLKYFKVDFRKWRQQIGEDVSSSEASDSDANQDESEAEAEQEVQSEQDEVNEETALVPEVNEENVSGPEIDQQDESETEANQKARSEPQNIQEDAAEEMEIDHNETLLDPIKDTSRPGEQSSSDISEEEATEEESSKTHQPSSKTKEKKVEREVHKVAASNEKKKIEGRKPGPASKTRSPSKIQTETSTDKSVTTLKNIEKATSEHDSIDEAELEKKETPILKKVKAERSTQNGIASTNGVHQNTKVGPNSDEGVHSAMESSSRYQPIAQDSEGTNFSEEDEDETNALREEEYLRNLLQDSDSEDNGAPAKMTKRQSSSSKAKKKSKTGGIQKGARIEVKRFVPSNWEEFEEDEKLNMKPVVVLSQMQVDVTQKPSKRPRKSRQQGSDLSDTDIENLCNLDAVENPTASVRRSKKQSKKRQKSKTGILSGSSSDEQSGQVDSEDDVVPVSGPPKMLTVSDTSDEEEKAKRALLTDSDDEDQDSKDSKAAKKAKNKKKKTTVKDSDDENGDEKNTKWMKAKELNTKLDLDSSDEEKEVRKAKKKKKRYIDDSDESSDNKDGKKVESDDDFVPSKKSRKRKQTSPSEESEPEESSSDSDDLFKKSKRSKKRKRIVRAAGSSSDSDCEVYLQGKPKLDESGSPNKLRKRKILKNKDLEVATQQAAKDEKERLQRQDELQKLYNKIIEERGLEAAVNELVLEFDPETKKPVVEVHKEIATKLKPHQVKGIKFMWNSVFESVARANKSEGSGCILAHCMGLGKTLQVVALLHTVLTNESLPFKTVLVVTPLTTVDNWRNEFAFWTKDINYGDDLNVYSLSGLRPNDRKNVLLSWKREGGILIVSYDLYRNLANPQAKRSNKREKEIFQSTLVDEGPDIIVCDEGHVLKNEDKKLSVVMSNIKTKRRIILTGTPLQNNLIEYHCMVQFVKPNFLGNRKEFTNRFVNPIKSGQHKESTPMQVKIMKKRACVLHKMLEPSVQRYDYSVLKPHLQEKFEYVIKIRLSDVQIKLYSHFMANCARRMTNQKGACLFSDYQNLLRVWNHPYGLRLRALQDEENEELDDSAGSLKDFIDDDSEGSSSVVSDDNAGPSKRCTRQDVQNGDTLDDPKEMALMNTWWKGLIGDDELEALISGSKMTLLFSILKECQEIGDKILVFSQSLYALTLIEYFLEKVSHASAEERDEHFCGLQGEWESGINYFRIDGGTNIDNRNNFIKKFNNPRNTDAKLFLVSTRAGGLGVNMVGANRVILFDASWNPSNDMQSIFRVYRFGQNKPCYIYRFLAAGTMEEKIYDRQVTKLALSGRVVDKQTIDRHFTQADLEELYSFNPYEESDKTPAFPKDRLLAELYNAHKAVIHHYFEHDSLLEDRPEEQLTSEEVQAAWEEFENEKDHEAKRREHAKIMEEQRLLMMAQLNQQRSSNMENQYMLNNQILSNLLAMQNNPNLTMNPQFGAANTLQNIASNLNASNPYNLATAAQYQTYMNQAQREHGMLNVMTDAASNMLGRLANLVPGRGKAAVPAPAPVLNTATNDDDVEVLPMPTNNTVPRTTDANESGNASANTKLQVRKDLF